MTNALSPELTIVIPVYRGESFIERSLAALSGHMDRQDLRYEIIAVDDGSQDDTLARLRSIAGATVRVLSLARNRGKGAAIKRGIAAAEGKYIVTTDADIPYGPESIMHCYSALRQGATFSIGDRTLRGSYPSSYVSPVRRLLSVIYSLLFRLVIASTGLRDTQCGLKGFRSDFGKTFLSKSRINRFAFDLEMIVFAMQNGIPVDKIAVVLVKNDYSSFRILVDPFNMFWDVLRVAYGKLRGCYRVEFLESLAGKIRLDAGEAAAIAETSGRLEGPSRDRAVK